MNKLLYNSLIINKGRKFHGYLEIEDEIILRVSEGDPDLKTIKFYGENAIDLNGHLLIPGVIDSHVHFREPGLTHKADIYSESKAAIAGGVTSYIDMPNTRPATLSMADIDAKTSLAAEKSWANYAFYIGASHDNIKEIKKADFTRVPGIKLFLGSSTGNMCVNNEKVLDEIFSLPRLIAVHCEDEAIINTNTQLLKSEYVNSPVPVSWHPSVRSALACYKSTLSAVKRARKHGTRLHVCHVSTAEELDLIRNEKNVTAEACIPHLWFADNDYCSKGALIKCNPSVKSSRHRDALRSSLSDGSIDVVSTDHAPHALEEKDSNDLFSAPSGMPMVQFSLRAMLKLAEDGILSLDQVVRLMCHNQADIFGIDRRGYIEEGYYADLVEIDPDGSSAPVSNQEVLSKCGWTPMEGEHLKSEIKRVWVNGKLTYSCGHFSPLTAARPLRFISK